MGVTHYEVKLLKSLITQFRIKSVIELGSQNLYLDHQSKKPPFADSWYKENGIEEYESIDLAGDNNSLRLDLSREIETPRKYDLVTDFGTSEHVVQSLQYDNTSFHAGHINSVYPHGLPSETEIRLGFYYCWLNKFNLCKIGGLIVSINPKTQNWPKHGYTYYTQDFYRSLEQKSNLQTILLDENVAMGNTISGLNIVSIMKKMGNHFPTPEEFSTLGQRCD